MRKPVSIHFSLAIFLVLGTGCVSTPETSPTFINTSPTLAAHPTLAMTATSNQPSSTVSAPTPTPASTPTPSPQSIAPPLPDLMVNLTQSLRPLLDCSDAAAAGQIWLSHYPYTSSSALLSAPKTGYYYPIWSRDGQWISFISVDWTSPTVLSTAERRVTDRLWIMHPDGTGLKQLGADFDRYEFTPSDSRSCNIESGLVSLNGWSANDQWIAFTYFSAKSNTHQGLFLGNVTSGQTRLLVENGNAVTRWSTKGDKLAAVTPDRAQIEVLSVDADFQVTTILKRPPQLAPGQTFLDFVWSLDDSELYAILADTRLAPHATLWRANIQTGSWSQLTDLGNKLETRILASSEGIVACLPYANSHVEILDSMTGKIKGKSSGPEGINCDTLTPLTDSKNQEIVGFVIAGYDNVLLATVAGATVDPEQISDGRQMGLPDDLYANYLSWAP